MRAYGVLKVFTAIFVVFAVCQPAMSHAGAKDWLFGQWPKAHWESQDFQPYIDSVRHTHHPQWDHEDWKPRDWTAQYDQPMDVIKGFYDADIIRDQYICGGRQILEVGPNFYHLGSYDRQRVMKTVDHVYAVTGERRNGSFVLRDWDTDKPIGTYTRYGLQMK